MRRAEHSLRGRCCTENGDERKETDDEHGPVEGHSKRWIDRSHGAYREQRRESDCHRDGEHGLV
jgi:hypothetical protein